MEEQGRGKRGRRRRRKRTVKRGLHLLSEYYSVHNIERHCSPHRLQLNADSDLYNDGHILKVEALNGKELQVINWRNGISKL